MAKAELIQAGFKYDEIDNKDAVAKLRYCAKELNRLRGVMAGSVISIGENLVIAHDQLGGVGREGKFRAFVETECGYSLRSAYNYMAAFQAFGKCATVAHLEDSAMYALAQKDTPEKAMKEVLRLTEKGIKVTQKQAKEIINKHKSEPSPSGGSASSTGTAASQPTPTPPPPAKTTPQPSKEEQIKAELKKARSYAEYLQRSIDDLNRLKRNPSSHQQLIQACGQILRGLQKW